MARQRGVGIPAGGGRRQGLRPGRASAMVLLLGLLVSGGAPAASAQDGDEQWLSIQAGRVITISGDEIEDGMILVRDGKIEAVGAKIEVPPGTPTMDARGLTVMPGLIHPYTRYSLASYGRSGVKAHLRVADELDFQAHDLDPLVEAGFTTIGIYPAGRGITGQAAVLKTRGPDGLPVVTAEASYIRVTFRSMPSDKVALRKALETAKKEIEKIEKARKDWEEKQKKAAEEAKKKAEEQKKAGEQKKGREGKKPQPSGGKMPSQAEDKKPQQAEKKPQAKFTPPKINEAYRPLMELIQKKEGRFALIEMDNAADFVHLQDVLKDYDIAYGLWVDNSPMRSSYRPGRDWNLAAEAIGKAGLPVVLKATVNWESYTRNRYNLAGMLIDRGASIALQPLAETRGEFASFPIDVADLVRSGLTPEEAFSAMTLGAARILGQEKQIGSIEAGRDADLIFFEGDPFDVTSRLVRVMIRGRVVHEWKPADRRDS